MASVYENSREHTRRHVASVRLQFLLLGALGISIFVAFSDILISILYDARYQAAGWMLPILAVGAWFSTLSSVNEWTIIGIGRAEYGSFANAMKSAWVVIALPLATIQFGILGAVIVVTLSDLFRYFPILWGQTKYRLSFVGQDLVLTVTFFVLIVFWEWLRVNMGLGTSFNRVPL